MIPTLEEIKRRFCIGWFGIPGGPASRSTKVHIIQPRDPSIRGSRGKIVCGSQVGPDQQFQCCSPGYGFELTTLANECQRCYKIAKKFWVSWHQEQASRHLKQTTIARKRKIAWHKKQIQLLIR